MPRKMIFVLFNLLSIIIPTRLTYVTYPITNNNNNKLYHIVLREGFFFFFPFHFRIAAAAVVN